MKFIGGIVSTELYQEIIGGYALNPMGFHGVPHWLRVWENTYRLGNAEGVDSDIFPLFSLFHDSCRHNDGFDPDHGKRGAILVRKLHETLFQLPSYDLERLCYACEHHTHQTHHPDPIIGICWDADRLDLPRVGIDPDINYMNSFTAISEVLSGSYKRVLVTE